VREAVCLGDRVVLMSPSPGRIAQVFEIPVLRARDINDPALGGYAYTIAAAVKGTMARQGAVSE
jgi:NitT/TauT family transport system ATP-binding protein